MKRHPLIVVAVLSLCLGVGLLARADLRILSGVQLGSVSEVKGPVIARTVEATDSPAIDATTATWTGALSHCSAFPPGSSLISLSVLALDATDDPASGQIAWKLWMVPKYGPMSLAAYGTWAMGTLEVSHNPETGIAIGTDTALDDGHATYYAWGETPVVTAEYWVYPMVTSGTTNDVGRLSFKRGNAVGFFFEVTNFASASTIDKLWVVLEEPKVN